MWIFHSVENICISRKVTNWLKFLHDKTACKWSINTIGRDASPKHVTRSLILQLNTIVRVNLQNYPSTEVISHRLLDIGSCKMPIDQLCGRITLPDNSFNLVAPKEELIHGVYLIIQIKYRDYGWLSKRSISVTTNWDVSEMIRQYFIQQNFSKL